MLAVCNADNQRHRPISALSRTKNWKIWAQLLALNVTDNKSSYICATLELVISWTRLGFIVFDNQRVSTHHTPLSTPLLCQRIGMPTNKIENSFYSWTTFYRKYWSVPPYIIILMYGISCNLFEWRDHNLKVIFCRMFNPNSSLAAEWRVWSVLFCPGLLVTLNQCQWSQKCLNIFPSRTMLQFTGYVPLISTQWHHKIFSLITRTTVCIIHETIVVC